MEIVRISLRIHQATFLGQIPFLLVDFLAAQKPNTIFFTLKCIMGSARFLEQSLIVTFFLLLYRNVLGQGGTPSVDPDEKNALYVLKSIFNNSIINESWKGDPCDLAYPWYGI